MKKALSVLLAVSLLFAFPITSVNATSTEDETAIVADHAICKHTGEKGEICLGSVTWDDDAPFTAEEKAEIEAFIREMLAGGLEEKPFTCPNDDEVAAILGSIAGIQGLQGSVVIEAHVQGSYAGIEMASCSNSKCLAGSIYYCTITTYKGYYCSVPGHTDIVFVKTGETTGTHTH